MQAFFGGNLMLINDRAVPAGATLGVPELKRPG
jgi:hypothetical protein